MERDDQIDARSIASQEVDDEFAPYDPSDGREPFEWETRYPGFRPRAQIFFEALYLLIILAACPILGFLFWNGNVRAWLSLNNADGDILTKVAFVWIGGTLGGTTFAMKWHYHSVARGRWHVDRLLWRILTPHLSAALAVAVIGLLVSDIVGIFDQQRLREPVPLFALSFLVGYFSDDTVAALARLASKYLGGERGKPAQRRSVETEREEQ